MHIFQLSTAHVLSFEQAISLTEASKLEVQSTEENESVVCYEHVWEQYALLSGRFFLRFLWEHTF